MGRRSRDAQGDRRGMSETKHRARDAAGRGRPPQGAEWTRRHRQPAGLARLDDAVRQRRRDGRGQAAARRHAPLRPQRHADPMGAGRGADRAGARRGGDQALFHRRGGCRGGASCRCSAPGDEILVVDSVYGPTRAFCETMLKRFGVTTRYYDPLIGAGIAALIGERTRAIFLESPGSHHLRGAGRAGDLRRGARRGASRP